MSSNQCCLLYAAQEGVDKPAYKGKRDRLHLETSCFNFTPLPPSAPGGRPRTHVTVVINIDAGMAYVPDAIISFILKVFSPIVYRIVVKVLKKHFHEMKDSALLQRLAQRPEYARLQKHADRYLAKQAEAAAVTGIDPNSLTVLSGGSSRRTSRTGGSSRPNSKPPSRQTSWLWR